MIFIREKNRNVNLEQSSSFSKEQDLKLHFISLLGQEVSSLAYYRLKKKKIQTFEDQSIFLVLKKGRGNNELALVI